MLISDAIEDKAVGRYRFHYLWPLKLEQNVGTSVNVSMWSTHCSTNPKPYCRRCRCYAWLMAMADTGNEEVMNQVDLPILDDSVCMQHDPYFIPNTEMCAGYENKGKDWCWDDLGSPLMSKANSGAWVIQGLASSGGNCTLADEPSNFEDVSMYTDWIRTTMEQAGYPYQY
ncbi:ENTK-like protein [Mya arenaria]|uniref:ENTK-like protein n=1 Tax=Mya arenaria TaxID=6604 RepID=A0ABY7DMM9_MYAAR|nr:ENTK-like protein [Mya arenaria]